MPKGSGLENQIRVGIHHGGRNTEAEGLSLGAYSEPKHEIGGSGYVRLRWDY